jgi:hypothetical protein
VVITIEFLLPLWLPFYAKEFGKLLYDVLSALYSISASTINRLFKPIRIKYKGRGRSTTKPGTLLKKQIPIKTDQWDETRPGFLEADTVAHCDESMAGMFAFTIDCVDIATTWTEQRAVWGKLLLGFDSDNGSEFLNYHLLRHFHNRKQPVQFTRRRPYHKDNNAHVEQKNWTHVRQWLGYHRLGNPDVVPLMNALYTTEWRLYHNFFLPSVKMLEKKRVASRTFKRYDTPKTPYQRVMASTDISDEVKLSLEKEFQRLNPFRLRKAMEIKLAKIFKIIYMNNR